MAGFAARTKPSIGVHDPLEIRAIAVSTLDDPAVSSLLLVADLIALDVETVDELTGRVASECLLPPSQVCLAVTHTHGGPAVTEDHLGGRGDLEYLRRLSDAALQVSRSALDAQVPVTVHTGRSELTTVAHNRRGEGIIDPAVHVVLLRGLDGALLSVLFTYACHPVVVGPANLLFTADWPGSARAWLDRHLGITSVFAQGCAGQINTGHTAEDSLTGDTSSRRTFAEAEHVGRLVADSVMQAMDAARLVEGTSVSVASEVISLPLTDGQGVVRAPVAVISWAGVRLLCLPGEPFVELGLDARAELDDPALVVLGYTGGVPGYIPYPPGLYAAGGYEICHAHRFYGQPAGFGPEAGLQLRAASDRLLRSTSRSDSKGR